MRMPDAHYRLAFRLGSVTMVTRYVPCYHGNKDLSTKCFKMVFSFDPLQRTSVSSQCPHRMCDVQGKGTVSVDDFMSVLKATNSYKEVTVSRVTFCSSDNDVNNGFLNVFAQVKFDHKVGWMQLHFGKDLKRRMRPDEFPQFMAVSTRSPEGCK